MYFANDWDEYLNSFINSDEYKQLLVQINKEYNINIVYPPKEMIFNALKITSYENTKVVIIGQDPYHGDNQAHGLSFSVQKNIKIPPSLKNIYKELYDDLGIIPSNSGDLSKWAREGVLLINSTLTVIKDRPNSHSKLGWQLLTDKIISLLNEKDTPIVFILWGNNAKEKKTLITNSKHLVLISSHPSPFSCNKGFFGSKVFSKTNKFLIKNKKRPIDWSL